MSEENPTQRQPSETSLNEMGEPVTPKDQEVEKELRGDDKPGRGEGMTEDKEENDKAETEEEAEEAEEEGETEEAEEEEEDRGIAEEELEKLSDEEVKEILQDTAEILSERDKGVTVGGNVFVGGDLKIEGDAYFDETHHTKEQESLVQRFISGTKSLISWTKSLFGS